MRIGVQLSGLDPQVAELVSDHLRMKWDEPGIIVFRDAPAEGELDGLLLIGNGRASADSGVAITDTAELSEDQTGTPVSTDDLIFQIDAKLGRLTRSGVVRENTPSSLTPETRFSRRDLFAGVRKGFRGYSPLPVLFSDACEAKYGCKRCVDTCPEKALRPEGSSIALSEADCISCGLCAAICPVGALQMPEFSETALLGLLDEIDESAAPKKTLVLTCDSSAIRRSRWMIVEQLSNIGMLGPRQIAAAAATSLGGVAVVCPDGNCTGLASAKLAVNAVRGAIAGAPSAPFVVFAEGTDEVMALKDLHESSRARASRKPRSGDKWKDYVGDLTALLPPGGTSGLMLSRLDIDESCTLCSSCVKSCPHDSLRLDEGHLYFSASTCTGCGSCVGVCPERSMTISEASGNLPKLLQTETIYEDEVVPCARCGAPLGSLKFVRKVTSLLGPDANLVKYCPACKKQMVVESLFRGKRNG